MKSQLVLIFKIPATSVTSTQTNLKLKKINFGLIVLNL